VYMFSMSKEHNFTVLSIVMLFKSSIKLTEFLMLNVFGKWMVWFSVQTMYFASL
jgi:hypothetical protein